MVKFGKNVAENRTDLVDNLKKVGLPIFLDMAHELDYISVTGTAMAILLTFPIQLDWFNKMITNHPQYNSFPLKKATILGKQSIKVFNF